MYRFRTDRLQSHAGKADQFYYQNEPELGEQSVLNTQVRPKRTTQPIPRMLANDMPLWGTETTKGRRRVFAPCGHG